MSSTPLRLQARIGTAATIGFLALGLPLLGAVIARRDLSRVFRFPPPLEIPVGYLSFSWFAAAAVLLALGIIVLPWFARLRRVQGATKVTRSRAMPWWGWVALTWTFAWWALAWTRFEWFASWQKYTFFPLWLGFVVFVNALIQQRSGSCPMLRRPRSWLLLFVASAVCWWGFEWLNRFVQNWHYLNVEDFSAQAYAIHATLCFSTVLPAVSAVAGWLATFPRWTALVRDGPRWPWLARHATAFLLIAGAVFGLVATGALPTWFYPALWVAPLALVLAAEVLLRRRGIAGEVASGNWTHAATWMMAALVCGFFWEMWNWQSLAKWSYTVPGVERWHVFEMPLLGYAGYLPFGLECYFATRATAPDLAAVVTEVR